MLLTLYQAMLWELWPHILAMLGLFLDLSVGSEMRTCVDDDGMDAVGLFNHEAPSCVCKFNLYR